LKYISLLTELEFFRVRYL